MVLSDTDIYAELTSGALEITPIGSLEKQLQPCSVDLRLGWEFQLFQNRTEGECRAIDPSSFHKEEWMQAMTLREGEPFVLHPGDFALACTIETVSIPDTLLGRVDGRSSIGRLGILVHATAGLIDPGFKGILTLELANIGQHPVFLDPGMRICQISFERLSSPCRVPYGSRQGSKYQHQVGATASRICQDGDGRKDLS